MNARIKLMSKGQLIEFGAAVLRSLPRDLDADEAQKFITTDQLRLAELLRFGFGVGKRFVIDVENPGTTSDVVAASRYDSGVDALNWEDLPTRKMGGKFRCIEFLSFHDFRSDEMLIRDIIEFAKRERGLKRPVYEHALLFGQQYPNVQRRHELRFLCEKVGNENPFELSLCGSADQRCIRTLGASGKGLASTERQYSHPRESEDIWYGFVRPNPEE